MSEENTREAWGFHPVESAKIFTLVDGEALPAGWVDSPAKLSNFGGYVSPEGQPSRIAVEASDTSDDEVIAPKKRGPKPKNKTVEGE